MLSELWGVSYEVSLGGAMRILFMVALVAALTSACSENHEVKQVNPGKSLMGFESYNVSVNGLSFRYVEKGDGELILFLHGFPYFSEAWYKLLDKFGDSYHVVAPDNRGFGYSDKPDDIASYHIQYLVADVIGLINILSPNKKVILVGHDWGAGLAWTTAQLFPEKVSKVVMINGVALNVFLKVLQESPMQQERSQYIKKLDSWYVKLLYLVHGAELFWSGISHMHENGQVNDEFKEAYLHAWEQSNAPESAVKWYTANIPEFDAIDERNFWPSTEATMRKPSLLIWSKNDPAFTQDVFKVIPKYVENLTIKIIDTTSHSPFLDHSEEVIEHIELFLKN
jgi:pimeloyl-ACP methyl ester carboxylesterase